MFKLNINSGEKTIKYKALSAIIKYLIDEKKLSTSFDNLLKVFNVRASELQRKTFLSENGSEIRISNYDTRPDEIYIFKVKKDDKFSVDYFRNHLAGFIPKIEKEELKSLHIFIPQYSAFSEYFINEEYFYQTFIEGVIYGNYTFNIYKSDKKEERELSVYFYADNQKKLKSALYNAAAVMEGVKFCRDLQNEPSVNLYPEELANRINLTLSEYGIKVKILDEKEIKKRKMGGLLAVGMGSDHPPRFIIIEYNGAGEGKSKRKKIALVGKGVTFDSGGISIKPAANMGEMKADMSGAAAVAGTLLASAMMELKLNIIGIIPAAENMVSGRSMRPGDIVITSSGKSIEVDNTDAEGRMILADALHYASKEEPDSIIDLATLTGACVVALGEFTAGLFTKNDALADDIYNSGLTTFERVWRMPLWDEYGKLNKSDVADVKNVGGRWGGAISAAKFLENFVDKKIPWAHLDIAGPAMHNDLNNYTKTYMTGFGVRLLIEYLKNL